MKILYLLPSLKNAGPVNVCLNLIKELPSTVEVTILSLNDGELFLSLVSLQRFMFSKNKYKRYS